MPLNMEERRNLFAFFWHYNFHHLDGRKKGKMQVEKNESAQIRKA